MKGHPITEWGAPCHVCDAEAAAFAAQLGNPPEELVVRTYDGKATYFRIPKHLRPRLKSRR
jgi:hypothetical protein